MIAARTTEAAVSFSGTTRDVLLAQGRRRSAKENMLAMRISGLRASKSPIARAVAILGIQANALMDGIGMGALAADGIIHHPKNAVMVVIGMGAHAVDGEDSPSVSVYEFSSSVFCFRLLAHTLLPAVAPAPPKPAFCLGKLCITP